MRINKYTPGAMQLTYQSDLGNKTMRSTLPRVIRVKHVDEALSPDPIFHWKQRPEYKVGDMDHNVYIPRDGSCHKHIKSFGGGT